MIANKCEPSEPKKDPITVNANMTGKNISNIFKDPGFFWKMDYAMLIQFVRKTFSHSINSSAKKIW